MVKSKTLKKIVVFFLRSHLCNNGNYKMSKSESYNKREDMFVGNYIV